MNLEPVSAVAAKLGVCRPTLYALIRAGKIPAYKIGRKVLLNFDEVLAAIKVAK